MIDVSLAFEHRAGETFGEDKMKMIWKKLAMAAAALFAVSANPAFAQATRTWVSGVGDDVNPCSRTAPCKTFAGAISKTAAGGEINCLDPGGFGTLTITKSITIDCNGTFGSVLSSGGINGFVVNDSATATPGTVKVVLNGLDINGAGTTPGLNGIRIISGRDVMITNSNIRNVSNAGISVNASTQVRVTVDHVNIFNAATGISVVPTSTFTNSAKISNSVIATSSTAGIQLTGSLAGGYIYGVVIVGTPKSLALTGGAVMNSYGNNVLAGAATDAPTPTPQQ